MTTDGEGGEERHRCPWCDKLNTDNWPLRVDGEIKDGGCQECWEKECAIEYWEMMREESHER